MSVSNHGGAQLAEAVRHAYAAGQDDYHLEPMVLTERGVPVGRIRDHDAVVFCCRRGEREIELTELFTADDFRAVERRKLKDLYFAILTLYHDKFKHLPIAFAPEHVVKPGPGPLRGRKNPVPLRGVREVRPCDLFLQRRGKHLLPR